MFKKLGAEAILLGMLVPWIAWASISITSNKSEANTAIEKISAKADRVITVEEKVDYIYKYLIEKNK